MTSSPRGHCAASLLRRAGFRGDPARLLRAAAFAGVSVLPPMVLYLLSGATQRASLGVRGSILLDEPWRLGTAWLVHLSSAHLLGNLVCIAMFGLVVAYLLGAARTAALLVLAELAAGITSALANPLALSVGASGAAFALVGAMGATFLARRDKHVEELLLGAVVLGWGLLSIAGAAGPGVDTPAHLGGLAAGAGIAALVVRRDAARSAASLRAQAQHAVSHGTDRTLPVLLTSSRTSPLTLRSRRGSVRPAARTP